MVDNMTHHSARAKWNTANAQMAKRLMDSMFYGYLDCLQCGERWTPKAYERVDVCPVCAALEDAKQSTPDYPAKLYAARWKKFRQQIREHNDNVDAQPVAPWTADAFAAGEPDDATDIKTPPVSEWDDERNSRPSQY
jgi:UDP:flavonoid glycosyltransferase YjiC (YdhE family)